MKIKHFTNFKRVDLLLPAERHRIVFFVRELKVRDVLVVLLDLPLHDAIEEGKVDGEVARLAQVRKVWRLQQGLIKGTFISRDHYVGQQVSLEGEIATAAARRKVGWRRNGSKD